MKDKSVLIASPSGSTEAKSSSSNKSFLPEEEESEKQQTTNDFPLPAGTRNGSSKYDFVKIHLFLLSAVLKISDLFYPDRKYPGHAKKPKHHFLEIGTTMAPHTLQGRRIATGIIRMVNICKKVQSMKKASSSASPLCLHKMERVQRERLLMTRLLIFRNKWEGLLPSFHWRTTTKGLLKGAMISTMVLHLILVSNGFSPTQVDTIPDFHWVACMSIEHVLSLNSLSLPQSHTQHSLLSFVQGNQNPGSSGKGKEKM